MERINEAALALMKADAIQANARMRGAVSEKSFIAENRREAGIIAFLRDNPDETVTGASKVVMGDYKHIAATMERLWQDGVLTRKRRKLGPQVTWVYSVKQ